jgi:hypothetical protein
MNNKVSKCTSCRDSRCPYRKAPSQVGTDSKNRKIPSGSQIEIDVGKPELPNEIVLSRVIGGRKVSRIYTNQDP